MTIPSEKFESAVSELLNHAQFLSDMHDTLCSDPLYLAFHSASTMIRVNSILFPKHIHLPSTLNAEQLEAIIKEAMSRTHSLTSVES